MVLNNEEIKQLGIIESPNDSSFRSGSYNLTIGRILDMNGISSSSFTLKPQGMVYVVFKEKVNLPDNIIGFAHVKTSLTKSGIMATNIGIIDPSYSGFISTLLINFGKSEHAILKNDTALRVTFSRMKDSVEKIKLSNNNQLCTEYMQDIRRHIPHLDEKFLNLNSIQNTVEKNVRSDVIGSLAKYVGLFTVGGFLIGSIFQIKGCHERSTDYALQNYEAKVMKMEELNKQLEYNLGLYNEKVDDLQNKIYEQQQEIEGLRNLKN